MSVGFGTGNESAALKAEAELDAGMRITGENESRKNGKPKQLVLTVPPELERPAPCAT